MKIVSQGYGLRQNNMKVNMEKFVLVFEIGSSSLRGMFAGRGINNTFKVKGYKEVLYDGFYEGNFLAPDKIYDALKGLMRELDAMPNKNLDKVYFSLPSEFSSVRTAEVSLNLGERRKIKKADIDALNYTASEKAKNGDVEIVSIAPITYVLDDGRLTLEPIGENASSLSARMSIVYASKEYIEFFNSIASKLEFERVEYISEALCQSRFVLPKDKREELALLVDVGDLTTSIAFAKGQGLVGLTSFSRGGGFITNDLAEAFDLSISQANNLKEIIVLSLQGKKGDFYELTGDNAVAQKILLSSANEVVKYRIDELGKVISRYLHLFAKDDFASVPVYLTGAGLTKIKGGRDYLAKCLGRNVNYAFPPLPGKDKPELASIYSLVSGALQSEEEKH